MTATAIATSATLYPVMRPERMTFLIACGATAGRATWIHGNSGIGKSQLIYASGRDPHLRRVAWGQWLTAHGCAADDTKAAWEAWSKAYKTPRPERMSESEFPNLEIVHLTIPQHEAEDFTGVPKHKQIENIDYEDWVTTWAPVDLFRRPVPVLLFLDEVSAAESRTQKVLLQLVQERMIANVPLAAGTIVTLAGNLMEDRAHLKSVPFTLGNRCAHFILRISVTAWLKWAETISLPGVFRAWVQEKRIGALYGYNAENPSLAQLTPRSLEGAAMSWKAAMATGEATTEDLEGLICANIGNGKGAECVAFLELSNKMAKWSEIVANPTHARLPEQSDLSMIYYTCGLLLDHLIEVGCDTKSISAAVVYAERVFKANTGMVDAAAWMITEIMKLLKKDRSKAERDHGMTVIDAFSTKTEYLAERAGALLMAARN